MPCVSALMSTYVRETAGNLAASLDSLYAQTHTPTQLVLVIDGPVGRDQEAVIEQFRGDPRIPRFDLVRLPENRGLAAALNAGLEACAHPYVMRMDSDDLCLPERLAIQLDYALTQPTVDVISSWVEEFSDDGRTRIKTSPVEHEAVTQALRWRNVLCHPTVFIKTDTIRSIGGYSDKFALLEDYDLFVRLSLAGARFHVIPKILVRMRTTRWSERRGGWRYFRNDLRFRTACLNNGFLNFNQYAYTLVAYSCFRLASRSMRGRLYDLVRI